MANAAVPRTRREDSFDLPEETVRSATVPALPRKPWLLNLLWAMFASLGFGFLFFGSVRVNAGNWTGRRMRFTQIWSDFLGFLAEQGANTPVVVVVTAAVATTLIGSVWLVWLALQLQEQHSEAVSEPLSDT